MRARRNPGSGEESRFDPRSTSGKAAGDSPPSPRVFAREHVMVSESLFRLFHAEMKRIAREWHGGLTIADVALRPVAANTVVERMRLESTGAFEAVAIAVESAKADLRAMVRAQAPHSPGPYLVPV